MGDQGSVTIPPATEALQPSRRVWRWWAGAVLLNMVSAGGAALGFALGGRGLGAVMGVAVLCSAPLLAVAPAMMWWRGLGTRRRWRQRPAHFR